MSYSGQPVVSRLPHPKGTKRATPLGFRKPEPLPPVGLWESGEVPPKWWKYQNLSVAAEREARQSRHLGHDAGWCLHPGVPKRVEPIRTPGESFGLVG